MAQVWLITGCSSGFGSQFVTQALSRGDKVIATARNIAKLAHLREAGAAVMQLDVTASQEELDQKASDAIAIYGKVDILVNNAAYTQFGTLEDMNHDEYLSQFTTNVFGTINTTRAFLPHFRERREGVIVNIGSMAAWEAYPAVGAYCASKAALRYATEALGQETASLGIKTLLVEPGQFRTELLSANNSMFVETRFPEYRALADASFATFRDAHGKQRGDPKKGVARIIDVVKGENAAKGKEWPTELALGPDAVAVIRKKCQDTLRKLEEWEEFSCGTDV
ncbi:putative short-chain oxidoreductase [Aspergillus thermomutatus]|uniref:Uncharacterized protein n=1 Tax=Aspergillus thermomutatus TaxID=41047 RepID=A0A397GMJ9_ASPTH|nr:uncharacterized protein CDV56_100458 [Aspergillus thermomutatus]RHZ49210.1 hypothetical protein CDV56_100458 [Aspergillus thermomutatus]